ncbi:MAG TPA: hypothetical protein PK630_02020 [Fervidobacterium sp.]|nr:hypothetical protein [Fervidobacterium sp.]
MEREFETEFSVKYTVDILNKKIKIAGQSEQDLKDVITSLMNAEDAFSKMFLRNIIDNCITQMRVMAWTGMDIKEWLKSVGYEEEEQKE